MGALTGTSCFMFLWIVGYIGLNVFELPPLILLIAFLICPTWILRRHCVRLAPGDTAIPFTWYYSLGAGTAIYLRVALNWLTSASKYPLTAVEHAKILALASLIIPAFAVAGMVILIFHGFLLRLTLPKFVEQDGTLCPNCGYCLLGVQSMRCPECGNTFTFEDLGMTKTTFTARSIETPQ